MHFKLSLKLSLKRYEDKNETTKKYFEENNLTAYRVSKDNGFPNQTIQRQLTKDNLDGLSFKVIKAIANSLSKTPGEVADELVNIEKKCGTK